MLHSKRIFFFIVPCYFFCYFIGKENKGNGVKNSANKETEAASQPGHSVVKDLKQQENLNSGSVSENGVLETSVEKNSVVLGTSTNWYFVLVPVQL